MPALDIFSSSAFSMVALTDAINKMPYVPGRIGQLGLFREQGVSTTSVMIEEREGSLTLVETTSRGAAAVQHVATSARPARSTRSSRPRPRLWWTGAPRSTTMPDTGMLAARRASRCRQE